MIEALKPTAARCPTARIALFLLLSMSGCNSYVYLPPEMGKRLVIQRGVEAPTTSASGTTSQPLSTDAINQALRSELLRVPIPSDVTQAALLLPPASMDEAFRNLAWKCTSAERKRLLIANTQYATFVGLLGAGLISSAVAATFSGLGELSTDDTAKTVLRASGIVMGSFAVIFNSLMAATAVRKNASATRSKYGEAQLALGEAQAEWPQVEDDCRARLLEKSGASAGKGSGPEAARSSTAAAAEKEPPPQGEDSPQRAIATCVSEKRRQILRRLSSRCLTEAELVSGD